MNKDEEYAISFVLACILGYLLYKLKSFLVLAPEDYFGLFSFIMGLLLLLYFLLKKKLRRFFEY